MLFAHRGLKHEITTFSKSENVVSEKTQIMYDIVCHPLRKEKCKLPIEGRYLL